MINMFVEFVAGDLIRTKSSILKRTIIESEEVGTPLIGESQEDDEELLTKEEKKSLLIKVKEFVGKHYKLYK